MKCIEVKLHTGCFHLILSLFKKIKRVLKLVFLPRFLHKFSRKAFRLFYSINWPNVIVWLPLLYEIFGNMCSAIVSKPDCDRCFFTEHLWATASVFRTMKISMIEVFCGNSESLTVFAKKLHHICLREFQSHIVSCIFFIHCK